MREDFFCVYNPELKLAIGFYTTLEQATVKADGLKTKVPYATFIASNLTDHIKLAYEAHKQNIYDETDLQLTLKSRLSTTDQDVQLSKAMMLWNDGGKFKVVSHPEDNIKTLRKSAGACDSFWKEIPDVKKVNLILSNALTVIHRDKCMIDEVIRQICKVKEVRDFIAIDHLEQIGIEQ